MIPARAAWAGLLVVAGCAQVPPSGDLGPALSGRLSVRVQASTERPAQSQSAAFEWRGNALRGELRLFTPLGTQAALASWAPGEVRLLTSEGQFRFQSLEDLAQQTLGERLPLLAWADWLAGRPWPGASAQALAEGVGFSQLGWTVDLSRRPEGRISARREQPPAVQVLIVLDAEAAAAGPLQ